MPWIAMGGGLALLLGWGLAALLGRGWLVLPPCPFKALTGWPCATCGLTRWGLALAGGDWRGAWHWHPAATLALLALPAAAAWDLRRAWRGRPYPELPEGPWGRRLAWVALGLAWALQVLRGV